MTDVELRCPDWEQKMLDGGIPASHALAERLVAAGYVGMRVRSFATGAGPDDLNLVFWRWGDRLPSRIELVDGDHRLTPTSRPPEADR